MNVDSIVASERRLRRAIQAIASLGAARESLAELHQVEGIMSEVRHYAVCVSGGDPDPDNTYAGRLLQYISGHRNPEVMRERDRDRDGLHRQAVYLGTGAMGSFAASLADAWTRADSANQRSIEKAFPRLFKPRAENLQDPN